MDMYQLKDNKTINNLNQKVYECIESGNYNEAAKNERSIAAIICKYYCHSNVPKYKRIKKMDSEAWDSPMQLLNAISAMEILKSENLGLIKSMILEGNKAANPEGGEPVDTRNVRHSFEDMQKDLLPVFENDFPFEMDNKFERKGINNQSEKRGNPREKSQKDENKSHGKNVKYDENVIIETTYHNDGILLEAKLKNDDSSISMTYDWGVINDNGEIYYICINIGREFTVKQEYIERNKIYVCKISSAGNEDRIGKSVPINQALFEELKKAKPASEEYMSEAVASAIESNVLPYDESIEESAIDIATSVTEPIIESIEESTVAVKPMPPFIDETPEAEIAIEENARETEDEGIIPEEPLKITADSAIDCGTSIDDSRKSTTIKAPNFKIFDSNISGLYYFVAPRDDYYALNSLQYVDFNEYLNILLKEQGYKRVIIVGHRSENGGNYPIIAYDRVSQISFLNHVKFEDEFNCSYQQNITEDELNKFCDEAEAPVENTIRRNSRISVGQKIEQNSKTLRFGKRVIKTIVPTANGTCEDGVETPKEIFEYFATEEVAKILQGKTLKTAIVVPLELLLEKDYLTHIVSTQLDNALVGHEENVLIITLNQESDFCNIFKDENITKEYQKFEKEINNAIQKLEDNKEPMARCDALIEKLTEGRRILIASVAPGKDEVANLLMRKKLQDSSFQKLEWTKIYALAEFLVANCDESAKTKAEFKSLENNTWNVIALKNLEIALRDENVIEALVSLSKRLWVRNIVENEGLNSTTLERIYASGRTGAQIPQKLIERDVVSQEERNAENKRATEELNQLIGLDSVKKMLEKRFAAVSVGNRKEPGHYVFSGNPGTGKTVVARLIGQIMHSQGILAKGHVVEVTKDELVSNHVGESGIKTRRVCEEALDGVLFIDEAYQLVNTDENTNEKFSSSFDREAYETLMKFMEDNRARLCVICAGYPYQMEKFREANPGMPRRIPEKNVITFPDYSPKELYLILLKMAKDENVEFSGEFKTSAEKAILQMWDERDNEFGNAGEVRNFLEECIDNASIRAVNDKNASFGMLLPVDLPKVYTEGNLNEEERKKLQGTSIKKLDDMIGLENVKNQIKTIINRAKVSKGKNREPGSYIFAGNPGTGKTVVARMVGDIMRSYGILKKGHTVEVSKGDLVAEYVGQSKIKSLNQCKKALDGVLFVDEAYELVNTSPYADSKFSSKFDEEAYTTILKFMEDHKDRICVIFAGYEEHMQVFKKANPGMPRRIKKTIEFEDYSDEEMFSILKMYADKETDPSISLSKEYIESTQKIIPVMRQLQSAEFGNAGSIIKYLNESIDNAVNRIVETVDVDSQTVETIELIKEDIPEEYANYLNLMI